MKHKGSFDYCYNGQISVDSKDQIIVSQHLTQNENDKNELKAALADIKDNTGVLPDKISLDKGYMTAENILVLSANKIDGYIATGRGEKDKPDDNAKKIIKAHFSYDESKDEFICPAGVVLKLKSIGKNRGYRAAAKACSECACQKSCYACKNNIPTMCTDDKGILIAAMAQKMRSNSSKEIYAKRKIIVEPVFGQIKNSGFRRFSLRGFKKAGGEFSLICSVLNFKKIVKQIKAQINTPLERELVPAIT